MQGLKLKSFLLIPLILTMCCLISEPSVAEYQALISQLSLCLKPESQVGFSKVRPELSSAELAKGQLYPLKGQLSLAVPPWTELSHCTTIPYLG